MTKNLTLRETAEFLKTHDDYLILTHRRPDGDTVGSAAALCRALRALGKRAGIYPNPQLTPKFAPFHEGLTDWNTGDGSLCSGTQITVPCVPCVPCVLSVDVASRNLFPFGMEQAEVALAIDHHGTNSGFAACTHSDETRAACGEILVELLPLLGVTMDKAMADALYTAISTDTGCFRYANVTANTFRCAAVCAEAGADVFQINRVFFETKRMARLRLEAYLTEHMEFFAGGRVALSAIPNALMDELGLTEDDVDDISGFGRTIEGVQIAAMLREVENGLGKLSLRTGPEYSAAKICAKLGGGGHPGAAGASVPGGIPGVRAALLDALREEIEL